MRHGGEGENGMKAVASVILNRVNVSDGEYARISQGGSVRNIIFKQGNLIVQQKHYLIDTILKISII